MVLERQSAAHGCVAGRFQLEEVIGRGGMGTVFRARELHSGRYYALKRGTGSDAQKTLRRGALLEREYHTLAQLAHPSIIEVHEYGVDADGPYYTMELLSGGDLHERGRTPWSEACKLLYDVASSLAVLHARGLLHRDVSLRNVRCTPEGRAKLIDFGAMAPMGLAKDVQGTAPFVAPEILQMQELDARADLFSLGAVGYYLLTGRNAYPARRIADLRDIWRTRPTSPARISSEIPQALSALILQLLMLDRNARPRSAAEVMERLRAIAGLPPEEHGEVHRAYLTTPALVGRQGALVDARREFLSLVRREGGTLLIEGPAGSGRSRMLDACVLEAKLLGVTVVRAKAGDSSRGDWGVARSLCNQLTALMREQAHDAARLSRDVLCSVIDGLSELPSESAAVPERSLLLRELRDFVLTLARSQKLLLAVDDVDEIDEPSAAFLAAIANKSERNAVMLAVSLEPSNGPAASASLRLLRLVGNTIALAALQPEETLLLVRSIFGEVANVELVAGRIHALAQGNPRATMDLAQHLVERGLARYGAGSWLLPSQLDDGDLPRTLADALASRLGALGADARALVEVQCLHTGDCLTLQDYTELAQIAEPKRVFMALDELLAARVFAEDGAGYRFAQRGFVAVAQASIPAQRQLAVHSQLADRLGRIGGDVVQRARHLLRAQRAAEAIDLLSSVDLQARLPPVSLLEQAIEQAERLHVSPRTLHQLRIALLSKASVVLAADAFRRCLPFVLAQLERDSGLLRYRELSELTPVERLQRALSETQQRYLEAPESERVYTCIDAMRELARVSGAVCSAAVQLFDMELLESLPSLAPFEPLSPALSVVARLVEASKHWIAGRMRAHRELSLQILERISQPDRGGFDEAQHLRTRLGLQYGLGLYEAGLGASSLEARAAELEAHRDYRVNAWRLRMLLHLNQGNFDEARRCERRAELLQLQESEEQRYLGMGAGAEVAARAEVGDLVGVKSCVDALNGLAERYPGWSAARDYGVSRYRWLQGDVDGALKEVESALSRLRPGRHNLYPALAGIHVLLLCATGRAADAVARTREYLAVCKEHSLGSLGSQLWVGLSEALSCGGDHAEAARMIESSIEAAQKLGSGGLVLGVQYEVRARIAIRTGDHASFDRFAELCAEEYKRSRNPALSVRFARLLEDARHNAIEAVEPAAQLQEMLQVNSLETDYNTVHSRMLECVDLGDRARCALTLLLQSTDSAMGYLFGIRDGGVALLAALPDVPADQGMRQWVEDYLATSVQSAAGAADTRDMATCSAEILRYADSEGRDLEPVMLLANEPLRVAAVLVLPAGQGQLRVPPQYMLQELAQQLLEYGDVTGVPIEEAVTRET